MSAIRRSAEVGQASPMDAFRVTPFGRLARVHLATIAGDALFAVALADSIFFDVSVDKATVQVTLYLLLTVAPFAAAAPLIGPALDRARGGRRWMVFGANLSRAALCVLLVQHLDSLLFFPLAFTMLVSGKAYQISKSAIVPTTVYSDAGLVEANSKLALISGLAVAVAVVPAALITWLGTPAMVVGASGVAFVLAALLALRLPAAVVAPDPPDETERAELHSLAVRVSVTAMGVLRGVVGFLTFLIAFDIRRADRDPWQLILAAVAAQAGFLVGAAIAPALRRRRAEEVILTGALAAVALAASVVVISPPVLAMIVLSAVVGAASSAGKQGFDAIVQRDAPDANRGRSFARFETQFQLAWVAGALLPVVLPIDLEIGFAALAGAAGLAALSYRVGLERARRGIAPPPLAIRTWTAHIGGMLFGDAAELPRARADDEDDVELGRLPIDGVEPPIDDAPVPDAEAKPRLSGLPDSDEIAAAHAEMDERLADPADLPDLDWHAP